MPMPLRLTNAPPMLDIEMEWTLNASLMRLSSYRKCSKRRILGHSAQATSLLPIEGMTKCSRIALGSGFGNVMASAAEPNPRYCDLGKLKANGHQLMTFPVPSICFVFWSRRGRVSSCFAPEYHTMNSFL